MRETAAIVLSTTMLLVIFVGIWVFQSSIERDVWNKCHPTMQLTLWEAMWSTTRIDQCEVPDE